MAINEYDIIVIGAGSGGLSIGLFMAKAGFKTLMIVKSDKDIGGECLNDGCVPSKALIHVSRIAYNAQLAGEFGLKVSGQVNIEKAINYVYKKQEIIRVHENARWLQEQGIDVVLGEAKFSARNEVVVNGKKYAAKKIVLATGSKPVKLTVPGTELVNYFDNENIFHIKQLPAHFLMVGGGPINIELGQALHRLGSKVTVIEKGNRILMNDDEALAGILLQRLKDEGINFHFNVSIEEFTSANEAVIQHTKGDTFTQTFDAVFVGVGRELVLEPLQLSLAGIETRDNKIVKDQYLRTTNKNVFVCGDIAGDLLFSHAAEFHARIILNNLFSPIKKKLSNDHMSWVTFTDPELATFGLRENQLKQRNIKYIKLEESFENDDRAVTDNFRYGKTILFISKKNWFKKQVIAGGTMIAPNAGELIQELILANTSHLSIDAIFNKIYPYPVASRINQEIIVAYKQQSLTAAVRRILKIAFKICN
ncbi:MAG: NAD(P)/FAD-dependent oxidoreductase [Ginsengibacter sp.]